MFAIIEPLLQLLCIHDSGHPYAQMALHVQALLFLRRITAKNEGKLSTSQLVLVHHEKF
jgi:hypothetical protein